MLHRVTLPDTTKACLTEAVSWQFRLLAAALAVPSVEAQAIETWLRNHEHIDEDQAGKIIEWLNSKRTGSPGRISNLKSFREDEDDPDTLKIKQAWLEARKRESDALLQGEAVDLEVIEYGGNAPTWRRSAAAFLKRFYDDLDGGLPAELFAQSSRESFTRKIFLDTFFDTNSGLCICPICDMTPLRTMVRESFYVDIDHFFPKSLYPHLAIHPYNLIPICHVCNSGAKKALDPLANPVGPRYRTDSIRLPYHSTTSLGEELFISPPTPGQPFVLRTFALRGDVVSSHTIEAINDILLRLYDIPKRWQEGSDTIGEIMFRRVREHLWFLETEPTAQQAQTYLDELLTIIEKHSSTQEPYSIAMLWWLVYLGNTDLAQDESPFLQEIRSWQEERRNQLQTLRDGGKKLRAMITDTASPLPGK